MSIAPLHFWFALAFVLLVGGLGLVADLALYRAYPELRDHDWGWAFKLYRRVRVSINEWCQRRTARRTAAQRRPGHAR